jgi:hypothetical protein
VVTFAADVVAALPELQRLAESIMVDTVLIRRRTGSVRNPETMENEPTFATVYEGRCRLVMPSGVVSDADSVSELVALQQPRLDLPVVGSEGVLPDDVFTVTGSDGSVSGRVAGVFPQSLKTARRLPVVIES